MGILEILGILGILEILEILEYVPRVCYWRLWVWVTSWWCSGWECLQAAALEPKAPQCKAQVALAFTPVPRGWLGKSLKRGGRVIKTAPRHKLSKHCCSMAAMEDEPVKMWNWQAGGEEQQLGYWKKEAFRKQIGVRLYFSGHTPYKLDGEPWHTTHSGTHLKITVTEKTTVYFHNQLWKDHNLDWKRKFDKLHVHHKRQSGVAHKDWPLNNHLETLEGKEEKEHLAEHGAEHGGRPADKRKRPW